MIRALLLLCISILIVLTISIAQERGNYGEYTYESDIDPYVVKIWDRVRHFGSWPFRVGKCSPNRDTFLIFKDPLHGPFNPVAVFACEDQIVAYAYLVDGILYSFAADPMTNYVQTIWPEADEKEITEILMGVKLNGSK